MSKRFVIERSGAFLSGVDRKAAPTIVVVRWVDVSASEIEIVRIEL